MKLRELMDTPGQMRWPLWFPSIDPYGIETGTAYVPFHKAKDSSGKGGSVASANPFTKCGGQHLPAHSEHEQRIQLAAFFCPHVVDIRPQYYYTSDEMDRRMLAGYKPRRNELPTLDLLLTIRCPWTKNLVYHAIAVKPEEFQHADDVQRRVVRDLEFCDRFAYSYEMLDRRGFSDIETGNHWELFSNLHHQKLDALRSDSWHFARLINASAARGTADRVLGMVGRRFGTDLDDSYILFAAAVFFGFLRMDMRFPYGANKELYVVRNRSGATA